MMHNYFTKEICFIKFLHKFVFIFNSEVVIRPVSISTIRHTVLYVAFGMEIIV
jgi:membrane protein YqaA with SNARE-associated domain